MDRFFNCFATESPASKARPPMARSDSNEAHDRVEIDMGSSSSPPASRSGFRSAAARSFFDCFSDDNSRTTTPSKGYRYSSEKEPIQAAIPVRSSISPAKSVSIEINATPSPPRRRPPLEESTSFMTLADIKNKTPCLIKSKKLAYNRLYCQEFSEDYTTVQFLMKIPPGAKPGQVIVNIGGRPNCSVKLPEYVHPGETVVLIARGDQKRVVSGASVASTSAVSDCSSAADPVKSSSCEKMSEAV